MKQHILLMSATFLMEADDTTFPISESSFGACALIKCPKRRPMNMRGTHYGIPFIRWAFQCSCLLFRRQAENIPAFPVLLMYLCPLTGGYWRNIWTQATMAGNEVFILRLRVRILWPITKVSQKSFTYVILM